MAAAASSSLKEYLKRYTSDDQTKKKKKKKPKPNPKPAPTGVLILDEDPVWQKPVQIEDPDSDSSADDSKPLVEEDIEVKRMKRLQAVTARKPYHAISDDGSGWVPVSETNPPAAPEPDLSPPRRGQAPDSPARDGRKRMDTPSPVRGGRPPRPPAHRKTMDTVSAEQRDTDLSGPPPRDLSPPRRRQSRKRLDSVSPEPDVGGGDLSPPRKSRRESPAGDLSPPRRRQSQENARGRESPAGDLSPPRQRQSQENARGRESSTAAANIGDLSPPRRRQSQESVRSTTADLSPPRRASKGSSRVSSDADLSPARKRKAEAPKTGLLSAKELKEENVRKKKEEVERYKTLDPALLGKGAEPVFRKEGKRISKEELLKEQEEQKPKEKKLVWGKGLAQQREAEAMAEDMELERDKPFARTRDDPDLDKMLKERLRWGDPMAHLVKQKHSEFLLEDLGDDEKMKESGFIVPQTVPKHSWIKRGLDCPPNRYGIRPGRHWDGVDRSTGYEKEMFKRQNEKRATETEAYLWSVSDM